MAEWKTSELLRAFLGAHLDSLTFANLVEFEMTTDEPGVCLRRCDLLTIMVNGGKAPFTTYAKRHGGEFEQRVPGGYRVGFELKVSKADLATDLRDEFKHHPLSRITNEIYFVVPEGLLVKETWDGFKGLPYGSGVIEAFRDTRKRWAGAIRFRVLRQSDLRVNPETPQWFVNALAHRTLYGRPAGGLMCLKRQAITFRGDEVVPA